MTLPLTERQETLWRYIASCDRSPTYDEMEAATGFGRSNINQMVHVLKCKGFVTFQPGRARSIMAHEPKADLVRIRTSELIAELERRGMTLGCST